MTVSRLAAAALLLHALALGAASPVKEAPRAKVQAAVPSGVAMSAPALTALKARSIGPAIMGGRVSDLAVDPADPDTFYVGLGTGGIFKTSNGGATFSGVFDKEAVASIGALAVAPSDPSVVWVGTGEANDRNSSAWGNGVYRSTDAGESWTHAGLRESRTIARIVVHPKDPLTAWVAVTGDLWVPSAGRGLQKTTDGGRSWKAVLTAPAPYDTKVGCGDVALDPSNPDVLWAALYARQRAPWAFTYGASLTDGKDLGGIFKSSDGGTTWRKVTKGLPTLTGRIGLDVFRKDPKIVYAIVQSDEGGLQSIDDSRSKKGGVFRSEDGGESFTRTSPLNPRAFYFSQIRVDPLHDQRVYVLGYMLHVSDDGGVSFREDLFTGVHADCHALVVGGAPMPRGEPEKGEKPKPPLSKRLLLGTDGGVYQSLEAGKGWAHLDRFAAGEFYRIGLDRSTPYRICGGLQDNLNWVGPSRTQTKDGILNHDWVNVEGGDGFYCVFDPSDRDVVYAESQTGELHRFNMRTGELKVLKPAPTEGQPAYRFHWNSPLLGSMHTSGALYLAGNRVFRLANRAEEWVAISPDLSTQDPQRTTATGSGAEAYGVVYALAESPVVAGLLWAGTDDGKLWVTENDGQTWSDLTAGLPAAVKGQWIGRIEPGAKDSKVAYLVVDAHRTGKLAPFVFRTADLGRTWQSVSGDLPADVPVKVVREDPANGDVLYAGTETGLFVSLDRGGRWTKLGGLPTVAVDDLQIHPRDRDLVIATHGRSLYVLDDAAPLGALTAEVAAKPAHLFPVRPVTGAYLLPGWKDSNGTAVFRGENPPEGALITYHVKEPTGEPLTLTIANAQGQTVAKLEVQPAGGLGRVSWDLRPTKEFLTEYGGAGPKKLVRAGEYTVSLAYGKVKEKQPLRVEIAAGIEPR